MIIIDSNALVVLLIGFIDPNLIKSHNRTSIYDEEDYYELLQVIGDINNILVLPNIWTEVDNLLNNFSGNYKYPYINKITDTIKLTTEKYLKSAIACENHAFFELGLTDSLILEIAKECQLLITSDSRLSDYAIANGIRVYDLVKAKNNKII
jgi:predicted nucleic acid-binding protein